MKQTSVGSVIVSFLREMSLLFILIWLINPQSKFNQYYNWNIYGVVLLAWILLALIADAKAFKKALLSDYMLLVWLWPVYLFFASLSGHAEFSVKQMTTSFIYIFFSYYANISKRKILKFTLFVSFVYTLIISINSFILNQNNSEISRILAHGDVLETYELSSPFLADFRFIYALVALSLMIIGLYKIVDRSKMFKFVLIAGWIWTMFLFVSVQYIIALMTVMIISLLILLFVSKSSSLNGEKNLSIKKLVYFGLLSVVIIIVAINYKTILTFIYNNIDESNIKIKILSILNASNSSKGVMTLERAQLYGTSISTFFSSFKNFLLGVGYDANVYLIGQHSSLFDTFGRYGIIGGAALLTSLITAANHIRKQMDHNCRKIFMYIMIAYVIEFVLNPVYYDVVILFFFFIAPISLLLLSRKRDDTEKVQKVNPALRPEKQK